MIMAKTAKHFINVLMLVSCDGVVVHMGLSDIVMVLCGLCLVLKGTITCVLRLPDGIVANAKIPVIMVQIVTKFMVVCNVRFNA